MLSLWFAEVTKIILADTTAGINSDTVVRVDIKATQV